MTSLRSAPFWRVLSATIATLVFLAAYPATAAEGAETDEPPDITFRVNVREVGIVFSAIGRENRALPTLAASDVAVSDDGVPVQVTSIRAAELPIRLGILIDASASLDKKLQSEIALATDFATRVLRADDRASLMTFAGKPKSMVPIHSGMDVAEIAGQADTGGLTALYDAVVDGCRELSAPENVRKVIVLFSDGDDTNSYHTQAQVLDDSERSGAVIYTIFIRTKTSGADGERWMKRLAAATGGRKFDVAGPKDIEPVLDEIERDIRSGYVLTFRPPNQMANGGFHQVSVTSRQPEVSIRAQAGYVPR